MKLKLVIDFAELGIALEVFSETCRFAKGPGTYAERQNMTAS
ncbi:hypothetical protein SBF1_1360002 [Candidatus Desulfosporosinus infrequens]|uniref:Uncharacterized protein n=1 Tax=Candidatus Desulfosporosinus infrequens TaxID=2043169 RepID=A0A2U3K4F1_9FIRM|nr:hypothetical protein SBF1_1360002 [Candidatus Desulfosporosinus infrequens]